LSRPAILAAARRPARPSSAHRRRRFPRGLAARTSRAWRDCPAFLLVGPYNVIRPPGPAARFSFPARTFPGAIAGAALSDSAREIKLSELFSWDATFSLCLVLRNDVLDSKPRPVLGRNRKVKTNKTVFFYDVRLSSVTVLLRFCYGSVTVLLRFWVGFDFSVTVLGRNVVWF
jgi:hypothetical protein